ncbi:PAS domain-containing protein [candidate division WWE3 bacterium]|nr:PAS domain-containing protein [candidate division WWE3 bacterium]
MDLWVKILIGISIPFFALVAVVVYRLLTLQKSLGKTKYLTLDPSVIHALVTRVSKEYAEDLDLKAALDLLIEVLIDNVSFTAASFLIPVTENSSDFNFKSHLVYEVPEAYVKGNIDVLKKYVEEHMEVSVENINREVEGGPINSSSNVQALSRVILPIEVGLLRGALCITSRKRDHFSEQLTEDLKELIHSVSECLELLWGVARRERRKFKAMVDSMRDGVFMVDEEYRFLIANPALKDMLGLYSSESVNVVRVSSFFSRHLSFEDLVSEVFVMGKTKKIEHLELEDKIYTLTVIPVKVKNVVSAVVCLLEDQTKDAELEEMRRDFSAMIIHELRSPLSVIRGTSDFLLKESANMDDSQEMTFMEQIKESSTKLLALVNNLLDSAKIESGKIELSKKMTDLAKLIKSEVEYYAYSARQKKINLKSDVEVGLAEVNVDSEKIQQVLNNLISNALKYTPDGGEIVVGALHTGDTVRLYVSDTGRGIADENKDQIFDKYKRVEGGSLTSDGEKSTGLGLAISKGIVEAHEGKIWVEDNEPKGSRFIVELPA